LQSQISDAEPSQHASRASRRDDTQRALSNPS
jgi:hypothetical protein